MGDPGTTSYLICGLIRVSLGVFVVKQLENWLKRLSTHLCSGNHPTAGAVSL